MKGDYVELKLGRQEGRTAFPKSEDHTPKSGGHRFTYDDDFRFVPYGDSAIAAYRKVTEIDNKPSSVIRVIGLVNPTLRALSESGLNRTISKSRVKIPKSEISKIEDGSDKEDAERILRMEFGKTSETVIFE